MERLIVLDKNLIKEKFTNSIDFYDDNAIIQNLMADKLLSLINRNTFKNILEIGSYSGILTKKIIEKLEFDSYLALDIVDSFDKINSLSNKISFVQADIEKFETDKKFDLIIANASLQWCNDFRNTINKLKSFLNENGILAITTFASDNFFEIRDAFNVGLKYHTIKELEDIFSPSATIVQEIHTLQFENSKELLEHLKLTGVNAISKNSLNYIQIKAGLKIIEKKYKNKLTYKPVYIID